MNNEKTITADGEICEAWGFKNRADGERYIEINLSEIYTVLIQEAGRWCESYASDLLYDLANVKTCLEHPDDWTECRQFEVLDNGHIAVHFRFGFRANGVDHKEYIECAKKNEHEKYHYYRSIWDLTIEKVGARRVLATLKRSE